SRYGAVACGTCLCCPYDHRIVMDNRGTVSISVIACLPVCAEQPRDTGYYACWANRAFRDRPCACQRPLRRVYQYQPIFLACPVSQQNCTRVSRGVECRTEAERLYRI